MPINTADECRVLFLRYGPVGSAIVKAGVTTNQALREAFDRIDTLFWDRSR